MIIIINYAFYINLTNFFINMKIKHLRQMKKGKKTFYYLDLPNSKPRKFIPLGTNLQTAISKMQTFLDPENEIKKFEDAVFSYFNSSQFKQLAPRTQRDYQKYLPYLSSFFKDAPLDQIQPKHISQYLNQAKLTNIQANRHISLFSTIFNFARANGLTIYQNPCTGVRKHKEKARTRLLSQKEFDHFLSVIKDDIFRNEILLFSQIGSRKGDTFKLLKTSFNQIENTLLVDIGKTSSVITFSCSEKLQAVLNFLINQSKSDYIFTHYTHDSFRHHFEKYRELSKLKNFTLHDLRAMAATQYYALHGLEATRIFLGHNNAQTSERYIRKLKGYTIKSL